MVCIGCVENHQSVAPESWPEPSNNLWQNVRNVCLFAQNCCACVRGCLCVCVCFWILGRNDFLTKDKSNLPRSHSFSLLLVCIEARNMAVHLHAYLLHTMCIFRISHIQISTVHEMHGQIKKIWASEQERQERSEYISELQLRRCNWTFCHRVYVVREGNQQQRQRQQ